MVELPTGTVTFLFTDLEGSTRLWEEHPDAMKDALARHDAILRESIEGHDGVVFSKMGDGIAAAFGSAPDAVAAAFDVQRRLAAEEWDPTTGPLRVRMGLHTDEGRLRAPGEYVNRPLNRCARLMARRHGGQVAALGCDRDGRARRAAGRRCVSSISVEHRLRDLGAPMRVFQLAHPDLAADFPPLRSLGCAARGTCRSSSRSFVGRDDDVIASSRCCDEALARDPDRHRRRGQDAPRDPGRGRGRCRASPTVRGSASWRPPMTASRWRRSSRRRLGCVQRPGLSLVESIVEYLKVRELLLVLDNCEHLLDDAGDVGRRAIAARRARR